MTKTQAPAELSDPPTSEAALAVAVIGLGKIGRRYTQLISRSPRSRLAAVCDADADLLTDFEDAGIWTHHRWRDVLDAPHLDAVVIATPPTERPELSRAAAQRGLPMLLEKPMAATLSECAALAAACTNATVQVAHPHRLSWDLDQARARIQRGDLGALCSVAIASRARRYRQDGSWYFDPARGGGVVGESLCNSIDLARWLIGAEFRSVHAEWVVASGEPDYDHTVAVLGRMDNGAIVTLQSSSGGPRTAGLQQRIDIVGASGALDFDMSRTPVQFASDEIEDLVMGESPGRALEVFGAFGQQWLAFEDAGLDQAHKVTGLEDELRTMTVVDAIRESVTKGQRVHVASE